MLLAIDTSTRTIVIALFDGNRILCENTWISKNHHTIELAPSVDQALAQFYEDAIAKVAAETGQDRFLLREWFGTQLITEARTRNLLLETEKEPTAWITRLSKNYKIDS